VDRQQISLYWSPIAVFAFKVDCKHYLFSFGCSSSRSSASEPVSDLRRLIDRVSEMRSAQHFFGLGVIKDRRAAKRGWIERDDHASSTRYRRGLHRLRACVCVCDQTRTACIIRDKITNRFVKTIRHAYSFIISDYTSLKDCLLYILFSLKYKWHIHAHTVYHCCLLSLF